MGSLRGRASRACVVPREAFAMGDSHLLVLGVGDVLQRDDGLGVEAVRLLVELRAPSARVHVGSRVLRSDFGSATSKADLRGGRRVYRFVRANKSAKSAIDRRPSVCPL